MRIYFNLLVKQNLHQNDVGALPNAELSIGAGENFIDLHDNQTVVSSQVGVDSTFTQAATSQSV